MGGGGGGGVESKFSVQLRPKLNNIKLGQTAQELKMSVCGKKSFES